MKERFGIAAFKVWEERRRGAVVIACHAEFELAVSVGGRGDWERRVFAEADRRSGDGWARAEDGRIENARWENGHISGFTR